MGAWLSYGLGNENQSLPAFVVLQSGVKRQPLLDSYWGSGFLPTVYQGVKFTTQFIVLDQPANALGIVSTAAVETTIGQGM